MKKGLGIIAAVIVAALWLAAACAPAPAPSASPAPPAAPVSAAAPGPGAEDAAWAKVVMEAKKEGVVNVYSYSWVGNIGIEISQAFEKRYGIKFNLITGTLAEFLERIKTEKRMGRVVADFTEGSSLHISNMKLEGLLTSVADELPAMREKAIWDVHPLALDSDHKKNIVFRATTYTPYVNTRLVPAGKEPTSLKDLLNPEWKGKMTLTEPNLSAGAYQYFVPLLNKGIIDEEYIKALYRQDLRYPTALPEELRLLSAGESHIQIRGVDSVSPRFIQEGAPIKAIDIKEGTVISPSSIAAIEGGPHPNGTKVLVNWLIAPEGQTVAHKAAGSRGVRNDVPVDFRPPAARTKATNQILLTMEYNDQATKYFREKWYDKVTGRRR